MSSRSSEAQEDAVYALLAKRIGLTSDEFEQVVHSIRADDGDDGIVYGTIIDFYPDADPAILAKVDDLPSGYFTLNIENLFENVPDDESE